MAGNKANETPEAQGASDVVTNEIPTWVQLVLDSNKSVIDAFKDCVKSIEDLIKSNKDVIESNEKAKEGSGIIVESNSVVVQSIELFREKGGELVDRIIKATEPKEEGESVIEISINPDAKYVVVEGRKFADRFNEGKIFIAGEDVTHLGEGRLKNLLSQGLIKEK